VKSRNIMRDIYMHCSTVATFQRVSFTFKNRTISSKSGKIRCCSCHSTARVTRKSAFPMFDVGGHLADRSNLNTAPLQNSIGEPLHRIRLHQCLSPYPDGA
jgi:hypothetical protein